MSRETILKVQRKEITPLLGAQEANQRRNAILECSRMKSSEIGRTIAVKLKSSGSLMEDLCRHYAEKLFKRQFVKLSELQRNEVYLEIVKSAGRDKSLVTRWMKPVSVAGKGLLVLTPANFCV
jgi:hypothetical protein